MQIIAGKSSPHTAMTCLLNLFTAFVLLTAINCLESSVVSFPPSIIKQPPHEQVYQVALSQDEEDKPFILECEAHGNPEPTYRWTKNDLDFKFAHDERISQQPRRGTLVFTKPEEIDEGLYQCFATNPFGTSVSSAVFLRKSELGSFLDVEAKEIVVNEGDPLTLNCNPPTGYPHPTISWIIQSDKGTLIPINSSRLIVDLEGNLHFSNVTLEDDLDGAMYACSVTSESLKEYKLGSKIILKVNPLNVSGQASRQPVKQYISPPKVVSLKGKNVRLNCIFGGTPIPVVTWNKKSGIYSYRYSYESNGRTLEIRNVTFDDASTYECVGSNGIGTPLTHSITVDVHAAPYWLTAPNNTNAAEEETVKFVCDAQGYPEPKLQWLVNGVPIDEAQPNSRSKLKGKTMIIEKLEKSDTAVYQCNASNVHGYAFKDFYLNVLALPPTITEEPAPLTKVIVTSLVILTCRVFGAPKPKVHWFKEGQELNGSQYQIKDYGDLWIFNASKTDEGIYRCSASNKFGDTQAHGKLEVKDVPNPPQIVEVHCDGLSAIVSWKPMADGGAPILSFSVQYNTQFTPDTWETVSDSISAADTHVKVKMSPWANYTFRVKARNEVGASEPSKPSHYCATPESVPSKNPDKVMGQGTQPDNLVISWTPIPLIEHNAPEFFYKVFWKQDDNSSTNWKHEIVTEWQQNQLVLVNLPTYKSYRIKVEAHNRQGKGPVATEVIAYSGEDVPKEAPLNFRLLYIAIEGGKSAKFKWDAVSPDSLNGPFRGYKIQTWTAVENEDYLREAVVPPNVTEALVDIFRPFSRNIVRICAFNDVFDGPPSDYIEFTTPEGTLGPVSYLDAFPMGVNALYLLWKAPLEPNGNLTGYRIYYQEVDGTLLGPMLERRPAITDSRRTRAILIDLKPDTKYRVIIHATTNIGQGDPYYIDVKTNNQPAEPDTPNFIWERLPKKNSKASVSVTWIPGGIGHLGRYFYVQFRKTGESHWDQTEFEENDDSVNVEDLDLGSLYEIRVVAVDGEFETSSRIEEIETGGLGVIFQLLLPGPISYFDALPMGVSALYLLWKAPLEPNGNLTGYRIYYQEVEGTSLGPMHERQPAITDSRTRAKLTGLKPDTKYRVTIYAANKIGLGDPYFIDVQTNSQPAEPDTPDFIWKHLPNENGKASVSITWVPAVDGHPGSSFYVQFRKKGENHWNQTEIVENEDSVILENLDFYALYEIRVVAVDGQFEMPSRVEEIQTEGLRGADGKSKPKKIISSY